MKMIDLKCPDCGGEMKVNGELESVACNYCGHKMIIDHEIIEHKITGGFDLGYEQEQGRQKALNQQKLIDEFENKLKKLKDITRQFGMFEIFFVVIILIMEIIAVCADRISLGYVLFFICILTFLIKDILLIFFINNKTFNFLKYICIASTLLCLMPLFTIKSWIITLLIIPFSIGELILSFVIPSFEKKRPTFD